MMVKINRQKVFELIRFNSKVASFFLFVFYIFQYFTIKLFKGDLPSLVILGDLFRHTQLNWCRKFAERALNKCTQNHGTKSVADFFLSTFNVDEKTLLTLRQSIIDAQRPFSKRLIILAPPEGGKKGVLLVKFTIYFFYLPHIFDLERLLKDYVLVLEPSFCGYFNPAILCLMGQPTPIIIQASEKVDYHFIESLNSNLVPIDIGANYWVDNRIFYPMKNIEKKYDIIMVALWADFKRHYHLFEAISQCKNKDKIKVCLVGMPYPYFVDYIKNIARFYNVDNCIEYSENVSQEQINLLLNKSKVCLLLSKKEGFNKSIIEAMFANTPIFLLKGFNYGQHYPYINQQTGGYIVSSKLREFIENIDSMLQSRIFSPNEWVSKHMTIEQTTAELSALLNKIENERNMKINKNLQLKINNPDCDYLDPSFWSVYSEYYKQLKLYLK